MVHSTDTAPSHRGRWSGGAIITFTDITERKHTAKALELLRQPLQTLAVLQGLLAKTVEGDKAQDLLMRLYETIRAMSVMT